MAAPVADLAAVERDDDLLPPVTFDLEVDRPLPWVRPHRDLAQRTLAQGLEPHRLPDAAGRRVEDPLRDVLPVLLAARDRAVAKRVLSPADPLVVRLPQHRQ